MFQLFKLPSVPESTTYSAMCPLNGGDLNDYYDDRAYPLDLNGAQDYTRYGGPIAPFPFPLIIGFVDGTVPQFNAMAFGEMHGKKASGPWMGAPQGSLQDVFPAFNGGMVKVTG
jgi:hypothetical protein